MCGDTLAQISDIDNILTNNTLINISSEIEPQINKKKWDRSGVGVKF